VVRIQSQGAPMFTGYVRDITDFRFTLAEGKRAEGRSWVPTE
jgi:hypothetical protein